MVSFFLLIFNQIPFYHSPFSNILEKHPKNAFPHLNLQSFLSQLRARSPFSQFTLQIYHIFLIPPNFPHKFCCFTIKKHHSPPSPSSPPNTTSHTHFPLPSPPPSKGSRPYAANPREPDGQRLMGTPYKDFGNRMSNMLYPTFVSKLMKSQVLISSTNALRIAQVHVLSLGFSKNG